MIYEDFLKLNNKYRMICEWDEKLKECDKTSVIIPCYHNKGFVSWKDEKTLQLTLFVTPTAPLERIKQKYGKIFKCFGENSEYVVYFTEEDISLIDEFFIFTKQSSRPVPPSSVRNITTFLRIFKNIHPRYKDSLEKYIKEHRPTPQILDVELKK